MFFCFALQNHDYAENWSPLSVLLKFTTQKVSTRNMNRNDVGVLPWGTNLPMAVAKDLNIVDAGLGYPITPSLVTDVLTMWLVTPVVAR